MSEDEIFVSVAAFIIGPVLWLTRLLLWLRLPRAGRAIGGLAVTLAICTAILLAVLTTVAASDVINDRWYIAMYAVLGLAWLRMAAGAFGLAGLSLRDDAVERRNGAALVAAAGAAIGVTCCYAGGNIGDGPGWWVVVFSAALASAVLFVLWLALVQLTSIGDAVTIDRDPAAGLRLGAFLAASGLLLGRAVAGDWESAWLTTMDATVALPWLSLLLGLAIIVERVAAPSAARPRAPFLTLGVVPVIAYVGLAVAGIVTLGWPE
jgi:hypothetical protein